MKDIIMEKNAKKKMAKFQDLFVARKEIGKDFSKELPKYQFFLNDFAEELQPNSFSVKISKIVDETNSIKSFWFVREDKKDFPLFRPGQFVCLKVSIQGRVFERFYAISSLGTKIYRLTLENTDFVSEYLFSNVKVGDTLWMSAPMGNFYYQPIRDTKDVLFLVGGVHLASCYPILLDCLKEKKVEHLSLIYGAKSVSDILWKEELDTLTKKYSQFKVTYVLSEEKRDDYLYGFISEEILLKENLVDKSLFVAGPTDMYAYLNPILKKLDVPNRFIRHEAYVTPPEFLKNMKHNLTIQYKNEDILIPCNENETLLESILKSQNQLLYDFSYETLGELISGEVKTNYDFFRKADIRLHLLSLWGTYPLSDVTIKVL